MTDRVKRHLSEEALSEEIDEAQKSGDTHLVRRLCLIRNLYEGDTFAEAGRRVGVSRQSASRWAERWNDGGIDGLDPDFAGGRPPKLDEDQRERLQSVLEADQPWTTHEVKYLIDEVFGVSYSDRHVRRLLRSFGMTYAKPRPEAPERPDDAEDQLQERLHDAIDDLDDDGPRPDGGYVVGFLDESWPQPTENRQRVWADSSPVIRKQTPTPNLDDATFGFYALNGESTAACKPDVSADSVGEFFRADPSDES